MKYIQLFIVISALLLVCSCTLFDAKKAGSPSVVPPNALVLPVGDNWQVIEEAPKLSNERGILPFQSEQSVQPGGAKPASPADNRRIEVPH